MVDDEVRIGMAIDERNAPVQIASEQDIDRKIMASSRAGDQVEAWVVRRGGSPPSSA